MSEKKKTNWFTQATLNAEMANNPAIMTASGWRHDGSRNLVQDSMNEPGVQNLRRSLAQIATVPLTEFGAELAMPIIAGGLERIAQLRQLNKGRQGYNALVEAQKAGRQVDMYPNPQPGDLTHAYMKKMPTPVNDARARGRRLQLQNEPGGRFRTFAKYDTPQRAQLKAAEELAQRDQVLANQGQASREAMNRISKMASELKSGQNAAMVIDGELSADSYPLYVLQILRQNRNGTGVMKLVQDSGNIRMIKLNHMAQKADALQNVERAIEMMRRELGNPNIPGVIRRGNDVYVPAVMGTKLAFGGNIPKTIGFLRYPF